MNKSNAALPILAATFVLLMLVAVVVPVGAARITPVSTNPQIIMQSIPEDDQLRNTGVMWFDPTAISAWTTYGGVAQGATGAQALDQAFMMRADPWWGSLSSYIAPINLAFAQGSGPAQLAALDPRGMFAGTDKIFWFKKISQFKLRVEITSGLPGSAGYTGVPLITLVNAKQAVFACFVYEKDKVEPKIPQDWAAIVSSIGSGLQSEYLKTVITDISSFFVCKLRDSGQAGIYVVDLYYIGPQTSEYVSDTIVAFKVDLLPAVTGLKNNVWGVDMQDLCILGWPFADPFRGGFITYAGTGSPEWQKFPHLIPKPEHKWIWSSPDPLDGYSNCQEAAMFQRWLMGATIPIGV